MGYPKYGRAGRPKVITLCGSTRFKDEINKANAALTMAGNIVISLGVFGHTDMPEHDWTTGGNDAKRMLDDLHRRKIDMADEIMVINIGGYIGESTRGEIDYAIATGKPVRYWALVGSGHAHNSHYGCGETVCAAKDRKTTSRVKHVCGWRCPLPCPEANPDHKGHYGVPPKGWLIEHTDTHRPESPVPGCTFCPTAQNPDYVAPEEGWVDNATGLVSGGLVADSTTEDPEFFLPLPCRWCHSVGKHYVGCHAYEENHDA